MTRTAERHQASSTVSAPTDEGEAEHRQGRGTRQLLVGRISFLVTGYAVAVLLARNLGPATYGDYGVIVSIFTWLGMVAGSGIPGAIGRLIPQHRDEAEQLEASGRVLAFLTSVLVAGACWFFAPQISGLLGIESGTRLIRIVALGLPLNGIVLAYNGILLGRRRFGPLGVSNALDGAAKLAGIVILLMIGISLERALIVHVAAAAAVIAYLTTRFPPQSLAPRLRFVRVIVSLALPLGLYLIAVQVLLNVDLWLFSSRWHGDPDVIGQYVAALNLARPLRVIPAVQSGVLLASLAWALAQNDHALARRHVQAASRFALLVAVPVVTLVGLDASRVMTLFFSSAYADGAQFLIIHLIGVSLFAFVDAYFMAVMTVAGRGKAAVAVAGLIPLVVVLNLVLIPRFGGMGAATSLVAGQLAGAVIAGAMVYRRFGAPFRLDSSLRILAVGATVGVLSLLLRVDGIWLVPKFAALGGLYLFLLWRMGELTAADLTLRPRRK